jgi:6-phosphogluconolactonase (cycloisomerase 2 family)
MKTIPDNDIQLVENEYFLLVYVKHKTWQSYLYLNKRNNRLYNINNNDHASFKIDNDQLHINWDDWDAEIYTKKTLNNIYFYKK